MVPLGARISKVTVGVSLDRLSAPASLQCCSELGAEVYGLTAVTPGPVRLPAREPCGAMAIAEAFSLGLPVVATDTGDISRFLKSDYSVKGEYGPILNSIGRYGCTRE